MLIAAGRFQTLQAQKEQEKKTYEEAIKKLKSEHDNDIRFEEETHRKEMESKQTAIDEQEKSYQEVVKRNEATIG